MKITFGLLFIFVLSWSVLVPMASAQVNLPPDPPRAEEAEERGGRKEELFEVFDLLEDFRRSFERIFHPVVEILSPLPVQLGWGVSPRPELVFEGGSTEEEGEIEEYGVLGARDPEATSFFVREIGGGVRSYSLTGDFTDLTRKSDTSSKDGLTVTTPRSRGEVWGERISRAEEEMAGWLTDSGVVLILLSVAGIAFLTIVFLVGRKVLRAIKGRVGEARKVERVWRES